MRINLAEWERRKHTLPEEQRREIEAHLEAYRRACERNPLQAFVPYPKQQAFLGSKHRTKAFFGGNRAGKTEIGVVDDLIQCLDRAAVPEHLLPFKRWDPPFFCRIVIPAFGQGDVVLLEKLRALCPQEQLLGGSFDKALQKQPNMKLRFKNGSWLIVNTGDQDRQLHAGVKLHRVHFDEEPQGEKGYGIYRENRSRLIDFAPESQMMFTMTPQNGLTWTFDEVWSRRDEQDTFCITASMLDNPYLPRAEVMRLVEELSDEERRMLVDGEFTAFQGRVIAVREQHLVDPPSPKHVQGLQTVYVGIDPGLRRGGVLWVGFDRDNTALVFDEIYPDREAALPEALAPVIQEHNAYWGIKPLYIIDPSGRNGNLASGDSVESIFQRNGIYPMRGNNDRLASVLQLRARLQANSLFISRACRHLLHEADRWLVAADEISGEQKAKATKGSGGSFATIGPDHLCDPLRYVCMERLWYQRPPQRKRGYGQWKPGTAPPGSWLQRGGPRESAPMGALS